MQGLIARTHFGIKGQNLNFYLETHATTQNIYFRWLRILPRNLVNYTGVWMTLKNGLPVLSSVKLTLFVFWKIPFYARQFLTRYKAKLFFQSCWPTRDHIGRSTRNSNPAWHLPQVVPRVVQTTGSVHPQPTLPNWALHQHKTNNQYRTANQI